MSRRRADHRLTAAECQTPPLQCTRAVLFITSSALRTAPVALRGRVLGRLDTDDQLILGRRLPVGSAASQLFRAAIAKVPPRHTHLRPRIAPWLFRSYAAACGYRLARDAGVRGCPDRSEPASQRTAVNSAERHASFDRIARL